MKTLLLILLLLPSLLFSQSIDYSRYSHFSEPNAIPEGVLLGYNLGAYHFYLGGNLSSVILEKVDFENKNINPIFRTDTSQFFIQSSSIGLLNDTFWYVVNNIFDDSSSYKLNLLELDTVTEELNTQLIEIPKTVGRAPTFHLTERNDSLIAWLFRFPRVMIVLFLLILKNTTLTMVPQIY